MQGGGGGFNRYLPLCSIDHPQVITVFMTREYDLTYCMEGGGGGGAGVCREGGGSCAIA